MSDDQPKEEFSCEHDDHPLKGVRNAALTFPGPTGTRPEHAKEHCTAKAELLAEDSPEPC